MTGPRLLGLTGSAELRVIGACPEDFLTALSAMGVRFRDYRREDELTARLTIPLQGLDAAKAAAKKTMCELEVTGRYGLWPLLRGLGKRCLLPLALAALTALVFWLQGHILFFQVEGNEMLSETEILRALEDCGLGFWSESKTLELTKLKNQALSRLPELRFLTVNTRGMTAVVVVREREEQPAKAAALGPANIIARKSGVITAVAASGGTAQVKKGDTVVAGQLLISGVTNLDRTLLLSRAEGEVYARTWPEISVKTPAERLKKAWTGRETTVYSLTIGKNTLNFYKTSGISYGEYDKIVEKKPLTLPGGYTLPVCLTVTRLREYETEKEALEQSEAEALLTAAAENQLKLRMTAGTILSRRFTLGGDGTVYTLTGWAECQEEIGTVVEIKN